MKFKQFQLEQIARSALVHGLICDWEPGLGKMIFGLAWPLIKQARRCLIVAPGGLHHQFREEALKKFGIHLTSLTHHDQITKFGLHKPAKPVGGSDGARTRFFITTYHELGFNHTEGGELPPMAHHIAMLDKEAGFDCVVIDEGTRLQADETHIANGVRLLKPQYRLVLTGTPIKNRLESIFWLLWWVAGADDDKGAKGIKRFPYPGTPKARELFASHFLLEEQSIAPGAVTNKNGSIKHQNSRTARLTNVHELWQLLSPLIIRMRKADCGEDLPKKILKPIVLAMGTTQARVYRQHLLNPPVFSQRGFPVRGFGRAAMQLNLLRQAALCPHAAALGRAKCGGSGPKRSWTDFTPKLGATLALIAQHLPKGEQVLIGSPFREFSDALQYRLHEAGVRSILLDGRQSPADRGELAEGFKSGKHSVLIAGLDSMGEGYNFDNCAHVILPSLSWAMDVNEQFIHRIWRLTSTQPVTIYTLVIAGSIDERLYESFAEKSTSAQLAIDHRLLDNPVEEIDIDALLKKAVRCFDPGATTIDEKAIEEQWHTTLRARMTQGEVRFRQLRAETPKTRRGLRAYHPITALGIAIHKNRLNRKTERTAQNNLIPS
jgi:hypothetical protein